MGDRTYLKKTMFRTQGTSTPVVSRSTVVAMKWLPGSAAQVGQLVVAAAGGGAFEGVRLQPLLAVFGAPLGVEVVHAGGHVVGVAVAGAEDDGLLLGAAGLQEVVEQVLAHGQDAVGQQDAVFVLGLLVAFAQARRRRWAGRSVASIGLRAMISSLVMPVSSRFTRPF